MKKAVSLTLALALAFILLVGCGQQSAEPEDKQITVAYSQLQTTTVWRQEQLRSIQEAVEANGHRFIFADAQSSIAKQAADIEDLITQGADYLVVSPDDWRGLESSLDYAKAEGVPVIVIDREIDIPPGELYLCYIGADFWAEGRNVAEWLVEETGGNAKVIEILGGPSSAATGRSEGFYGVVDNYPGIEILASQTGSWTKLDAQNVMENLIQAHGSDIEVVYSHADEMTLGILVALGNAGMNPGTDVLVCGVDGTYIVVQRLLSGEMNANYLCDNKFGPAVADVIEKHRRGEEIPGQVVLEGFLFTQENVAANIQKSANYGID